MSINTVVNAFHVFPGYEEHEVENGIISFFSSTHFGRLPIFTQGVGAQIPPPKKSNQDREWIPLDRRRLHHHLTYCVSLDSIRQQHIHLLLPRTSPRSHSELCITLLVFYILIRLPSKGHRGQSRAGDVLSRKSLLLRICTVSEFVVFARVSGFTPLQTLETKTPSVHLHDHSSTLSSDIEREISLYTVNCVVLSSKFHIFWGYSPRRSG